MLPGEGIATATARISHARSIFAIDVDVRDSRTLEIMAIKILTVALCGARWKLPRLGLCHPLKPGLPSGVAAVSVTVASQS
jgi:hypothetical protein